MAVLKSKPDALQDDECEIHVDKACNICPRYRLTVRLFTGRTEIMDFWIGQNAGMSWGPIGMEDEVHLKYIDPTK